MNRMTTSGMKKFLLPFSCLGQLNFKLKGYNKKRCENVINWHMVACESKDALNGYSKIDSLRKLLFSIDLFDPPASDWKSFWSKLSFQGISCTQ